MTQILHLINSKSFQFPLSNNWSSTIKRKKKHETMHISSAVKNSNNQLIDTPNTNMKKESVITDRLLQLLIYVTA